VNGGRTTKKGDKTALQTRKTLREHYGSRSWRRSAQAAMELTTNCGPIKKVPIVSP
jgi:hypothetical protein